MATKKYVSLSKLSDFLDNLKNVFAYKVHTHTTSEISDFVVDAELSNSSINPVQNKIIDAEFEAVSQAMVALESAIDDKADVAHSHAISDITNLQTTLTDVSSAISANTSSISAHTDRITALETKVGDGFEEITSAEIQALFA